jgi:hypothetical protein
MRRSSKSSVPKLSTDSRHLAGLANAIVQAGSRLEERVWERNLDTLLLKLLKTGHQDTIDAALDHLFKAGPGAYDALMESAEAASASCCIEHDGDRYDALLIAIPILAWTRFVIASGAVPAEMLMTLSAHLYGHVLASDTKLAMTPTLFAIDQLPRSHVETFALTQRMAQAALASTALRPLVNPPETAPFLADTRYLLAVVVAPAGAPLFRWQMPENQFDVSAAQQAALTQWRTQAMPTIERLLPGCGIEVLLPEAYYVGCREADKQIRPASIHAAIHYLTHTLNIEPSGLSAIVGSFGEESIDGRVDEYRISFTLHRHPDVIYGVVWPLYEQEDAEEQLESLAADRIVHAGMAGETEYVTPIEKIFSLLRESGITDIKHHEEHFPMEFCEDCGAPLYCDPEAELMHAEMPEDAPHSSGHFH